MNQTWIERLREAMPQLALREQEPMAAHTSFRIGGPAEAMAFPAREEELAQLLAFASREGIPCLLLGAGSNLLAPDEGLAGLVIGTRDGLRGLCLEEKTTILAQSGVTLARLAGFAAEHGLTGLEFAQGIPGTVGGGIFMNAGAYGGELSDCAVLTRVVFPDGTDRSYRGAEQGLRYRGSVFQTLDGAVSAVRFCLQPGEREQIQEKMRELAARRREKQPLDLPSAGSTFKRPVGGFAAALIDQAGLKGTRVGGAAVSEKHAGFVVNLGGATAEDVKRLIALVQQRVLETSGIQLEPEIRILGGN